MIGDRVRAVTLGEIESALREARRRFFLVIASRHDQRARDRLLADFAGGVSRARTLADLYYRKTGSRVSLRLRISLGLLETALAELR